VTALVVTETPPPQPEREAAEAGRAESLPAEQPSVARRINRLPELASAAGPTFTAVGLALFVVLNLASTAVYAPLGVTPADVGLGYADLLAQSAVGVTAGFLIALLIGGVTALLRSQPGRRPAWATLAVIAAVAVVELDIALALPVLDHPLISVTELAVFMVAVVASVVTLLRRPALRQRALVEATRPGLALPGKPDVGRWTRWRHARRDHLSPRRQPTEQSSRGSAPSVARRNRSGDLDVGQRTNGA
jgi:hypothetical protein